MSLEEWTAQEGWEIWYQDLFDRETPRQLEKRGRGLVRGLVELWTRHLFETVQPDGQQGFSRFNLWWVQAGLSVEIVGDWDGQVRLRGWIYGSSGTGGGEISDVGKALVGLLAAAHRGYVLRGETSEGMLRLAKTAAGRKDFETRLSRSLGSG